MSSIPLQQDSRPAAVREAYTGGWARLGLTHADVFDPDRVAQRLSQGIAGDADVRGVIVAELGAANAAGRAAIADALRLDPFAADEAISAYSHLTDQVVLTAAHAAMTHLHPNPNPTACEQMAILAVGGYGRAAMAPFSDVDLLFLTPYKQTAWGESVIESILYILWDLKMKLGHSVRTVSECLRQAQADMTIRTALLEHRFLTGARDLADELDARLWAEVFDRTGPQFVEAKLEERETRHRRNGGSRYLLEPNVKESKGGLRDLQTLYWIAKYVNHAASVDDLVAKGVFTAAEVEIFRAAESFLWATRVHMHLIAGRATEQLTFDMQVEVARALGFTDSAGQRAVERFMQTYFTHAKRVGELTRIFLVALEAQHVKKRPSLTRKIVNAFTFGGDKTPDGYFINNGRLDIENVADFMRDPVNILRLFQEALRADLTLHPNAMRAVAAHLHLIDETVRQDPVANQVFLDILLDPTDPTRGLRRMNELGVLGAFIPEFGQIVAMMQYNMYHHYTVDEHTLQCLTQLFEIESGALNQDLPVASAILKRGVNRRVLHVAILLHDIGKGREADHSEVGAEIAARLCPRLGLPPDECDTVVWLVRNHLIMSDFAQKRDLADARTLTDFARIVQSPARLKLLCVLTVCDIRGVGPGIWNNWKAMLLRELYARTLEILTGVSEGQSLRERIAEARADFRAALPDWTDEALDAECNRHYGPFWLGLTLDTQIIFARLMREVTDTTPAIRLDGDLDRDATRACFVMPDHPGLFSRLAGALALAGANVMDARTYTTSDGFATAVFWIQDETGKPFEEARLKRLRRTIARTLSGEVVAREEFRTRDRIKKRERDFIVPTEITFDNDGSEIFSIIEVDTRDRPGLLYDLTRTLTAANISISSAIIATYGEQVVDTFYVKDLFGLKIHSKAKQDQIAERLRNAIRQGAKRAEA